MIRALPQWRMWARLRQVCCSHAHLQRVTVNGLRYFQCDCGYQVPQIQRSVAELERMRRLVWRAGPRSDRRPTDRDG
jgi:hypothetical protein